MSEEIRIYVADLKADLNGIMHGVWINACDDVETINNQIKDMLAHSPVEGAEEWAIYEYDGFSGFKISENEGIEYTHDVACFIEEFPDFGAPLLDSFCGVLDEARKAAEENYSGCHSSVADFAQELTEETSEIPENLAFYIDYEKMGRDLEMSGDIFTIETGFQEVHIFWSH